MKKPDIIFIHGMFSIGRVWQAWQQYFTDAGYTCHNPTLPGHNVDINPQVVDGKSFDDYTLFLSEYISRFTKPILIGHSMGGLLAQKLAQHCSLSAVILINSAAPGHIFPIRLKMLPGLIRHFFRWRLWRSRFSLSEGEANYLLFNKVSPAEKHSLLNTLVPESGRILFELGLGKLNVSKNNRIDKTLINCPVLFYASVEDNIIPISVSRKTAKWYSKRADYLEWQVNGHWLIGEHNWQQVIEGVEMWLETKQAQK